MRVIAWLHDVKVREPELVSREHKLDRLVSAIVADAG